MQAYRNAAFLAYGSWNFTKASFNKHAISFKEEEMRADLTGVNCVVTGANAGIGKAAAQALAARGANVELLCRNKERCQAALEDIKSATGSSNLTLEICDMASLEQIRSYAKKFNESEKPLHVLVNNAGIMAQDPGRSPDGLEMNFAVNVMGVFSLTELLLPALDKAAPNAKAICVATGGVLTEPLSADLQGEKMSKHDGTVMYARNKRVQLAVTEKWAELYKDKGIVFVSMHPGWVDTATLQSSMPGFYNTFKAQLRTAEQGADTIAWLAMRPNCQLSSSGFYFDRAEVSKHLPLANTAHPKAVVDNIYNTLAALLSPRPA